MELHKRIESLSVIKRQLLFKKMNEIHSTKTSSIDGPKNLIAYIKYSDKDKAKNNTIKHFLETKIPNYMIPSSFYQLEEIPKLPNGKLDRGTLQKSNFTHTEKLSETLISETKNNIENELVKIWEETLNIAPISTNDNFFDIGGDSILSIQVISKARRKGIMLSPNQLFEKQTISGLSQLIIAAEKEKEEWDFMAVLRDGGNKKPLFCIHSGGGHVFFYGLLKKYLKIGRPIYAVQPKGLYDSHKLHKSVKDMSKEYLKAIRQIQPKGPYNILVYCFSTSVGNEMAIQLGKIGEEINIIVMDTMASPWSATDSDSMKTRIRSFLKRFFMNPFKAIKTFFSERVYLLEAFFVKFSNNVEKKQLEALKANLRRISVDYEWKAHNGKVSLIITDKPDARFNEHIINSWGKFAKGGVTTYKSKGHHTTLFEEPDIQYVSKSIDQCLID